MNKESGASKCLIALICVEVCNIHPTFNAGKLPDSGVTALAYVAHSCPDPEVINLMLTSVMEHLYFWYRGSSIIRLISLLCLSETNIPTPFARELLGCGTHASKFIKLEGANGRQWELNV
ncbi:uncharacterized protein LOC141642364 [Silene latifolia]|uniref:uncharacterized protein LOC141642364 n=1 Tax=Silene latifolia TaxID=37657 RepID=UPI003D778D12